MKQPTSVSKPLYVIYGRVISLVFPHIGACWPVGGCYKKFIIIARLNCSNVLM